MNNQKPIKIHHFISFDFIAALLAIGPGVISWSLVILLAIHFSSSKGLLILILLVSPLLLSLTFISILAIFRMLIPKLKPGVTHIGFNKGTFAWYCHLALNRSLKVSGFRYLLNVSYVLKFLVYRALGAKIGFGIHTPMEYTLVDLTLLEIGAGTSFGENVHVFCHYFTGDRLLLKSVKIGKNCFLGTNCIVGPGSQIGNNAYVGFGNIVSGDSIADGEHIGDGEWKEGSPKRALKAKQTNLARKKASKI
ncbi:MAG: hypothetical protein ABI370_13100 [Gammaproteobacteria bacterium]